MKVIGDGFGGDNAPLAVLEGCRMAADEYGVEIILTGDEQKLRDCAEEHGISLGGMEIVHAPSVIPVDAHPQDIMTEYADSSMAEAMRLLAAGKGDAVVCAGSTGAMVVSASLMVRRIKGIKRATLAPIIPSESGCYILMDAGANVECRPEMLLQFGIMGSIYMEHVVGIKNPRVAIVNIGAEEEKGNALVKETFPLLKACPDINFIGSIEAREIPHGGADVIVCEAFTGNVILKLYEGVGATLIHMVKQGMMATLRSKIGALLVKPALKTTLKAFDASQYGGAPLLGLKGLVVKTHGSSKRTEVRNSIIQCVTFKEQEINEKIKESLTVGNGKTEEMKE